MLRTVLQSTCINIWHWSCGLSLSIFRHVPISFVILSMGFSAGTVLLTCTYFRKYSGNPDSCNSDNFEPIITPLFSPSNPVINRIVGEKCEIIRTQRLVAWVRWKSQPVFNCSKARTWSMVCPNSLISPLQWNYSDNSSIIIIIIIMNC